MWVKGMTQLRDEEETMLTHIITTSWLTNEASLSYYQVWGSTTHTTPRSHANTWLSCALRHTMSKVKSIMIKHLLTTRQAYNEVLRYVGERHDTTLRWCWHISLHRHDKPMRRVCHTTTESEGPLHTRRREAMPTHEWNHSGPTRQYETRQRLAHTRERPSCWQMTEKDDWKTEVTRHDDIQMYRYTDRTTHEEEREHERIGTRKTCVNSENAKQRELISMTTGTKMQGKTNWAPTTPEEFSKFSETCETEMSSLCFAFKND